MKHMKNIQEQKTLRLHLKERWYRMIESGEKTEEYREITDYWTSRLLDKGCLHFDVVEFSLGYPKRDDETRHMAFRVAGIYLGEGNPRWGAPEGKSVFIIKIGERIPCTRLTD